MKLAIQDSGNLSLNLKRSPIARVDLKTILSLIFGKYFPITQLILLETVSLCEPKKGAENKTGLSSIGTPSSKTFCGITFSDMG